MAGPVSADSANSIQGLTSLVQKKNGLVQHSYKQTTLAPYKCAASIIVPILSKIASLYSINLSVVGLTIWFYIAATLTKIIKLMVIIK